LGPVEVSVDGRHVRFARRQQRLILGILALQGDEVISSERLIDLIWGERPPAQARAVLQTRISEVRTALHSTVADPDVRLLTTGDGYVLRAPSDRIDASRFRSLLMHWREADSDEAARTTLREALDLWRGPVLGSAATTETLLALCYGLESARLAAQEDLFDVELRLGNHFLVVDEIVTLSGAHPTRERLFALMMSALHRVGRSAEALQAFERWRRWLSDELGTDPGDLVRQTHLTVLGGRTVVTDNMGTPRAAISSDGDSPSFRVAVPRTLPPDIADFTGRDREAGVLHSLLTRERPGVVAVSGRGGVGKTTLCVHAAHSLREQYVDGQLYVSLRGAGDDDPPKPSEVLGRFLRSLGVEGPGLPDSLDERVDLYRDLLSNRRVLVVLDNAATVEQVLPLIPGGSGCGVLINSRARFGSAVGAETLDLNVFATDEAVGLLSRIVGSSRVSDETDAVADLALHCGHLPLALRIAAAKLVAKPHWRVETLVMLLAEERHRLDQFAVGSLDVRASIALSYAGLNVRAQRLLQLIGDIDLPDVTVWVCAALLDTSEVEAQAVLEQLFDAQLLDAGAQSTARSQRYQLHDLVRLFANEQAEQTEPAVLEAARARAFGAWLFVVDAAHKMAHFGLFHIMRGSAPRRVVSRREIEAMLADPAHWFEMEWSAIVAMVRRAESDGRTAECWELACGISGYFEMRRQHIDGWNTILEVAAAATRAAGDDRGLAATLHRMGSAACFHIKYDEAAAHWVQSAALFERAGDRHGHGMAMAYLATIERITGHDDPALRHYAQALHLLSDSPDRSGEAYVLRCLGQAETQRGNLAAAETNLTTALRIYGLTGARQGEAQARFFLGMVRLEQGRQEEARADIEAALATTRAMGDRPGEAQCLRGLGAFYQRQGDRDAARTILFEVLQLVCQPRPTHMERLVRQSIAELQ
jgi:DNA-binding SARP family transcriptional activator/tetratricopeptide (TPR) repeat protein